MTTPENAPRLEQWATTGTIATTLGLSRQSVNRMINEGQFETLVVVPGPRDQYLVEAAELEKIRVVRTTQAEVREEAKRG